MCFQFTHFRCDAWENIYPLSYYHQIGSMNYYSLFRVRSWNNGMCCMSFYILSFIFSSNNSVSLGLHFSVNRSIHPSDRWLLYERDKTFFRQWSGIKHSLTFNVADHNDCLELHGPVIFLNVRLFQRIDFEGPVMNFSYHVMCHILSSLKQKSSWIILRSLPLFFLHLDYCLCIVDTIFYERYARCKLYVIHNFNIISH